MKTGTRWSGLLASLAILACATRPACGDGMYNVTNLGSMGPVDLDNQGRAYLNQSSTSTYHNPQPALPRPNRRQRACHGPAL